MIYTMDYLMKDGVDFRTEGITNIGDGVEWSFEHNLRYSSVSAMDDTRGTKRVMNVEIKPNIVLISGTEI